MIDGQWLAINFADHEKTNKLSNLIYVYAVVYIYFWLKSFRTQSGFKKVSTKYKFKPQNNIDSTVVDCKWIQYKKVTYMHFVCCQLRSCNFHSLVLWQRTCKVSKDTFWKFPWESPAKENNKSLTRKRNPMATAITLFQAYKYNVSKKVTCFLQLHCLTNFIAVKDHVLTTCLASQLNITLLQCTLINFQTLQ